MNQPTYVVHRHMVTSWDDPLVAPYRNLRERTLRGETVFIAEGRDVTERLLRSRFPTASVLVTDEAADEIEAMIESTSPDRSDRSPDLTVPLLRASGTLIREVVGFPFHRGVMALGRRRPLPSPEELIRSLPPEGPVSLIVCPHLTSPDNLGLLFRTAAGLGVDGVLLGPRSCDPFSRRALRVSMGGVLFAPVAASEDIDRDLDRLQREWNVKLVATVLSDRAEPLDTFRWPRRTAVLFGREYEGLDEAVAARCDLRVTIPMRASTDSLNVGVAAGIFTYTMMRRER